MKKKKKDSLQSNESEYEAREWKRSKEVRSPGVLFLSDRGETGVSTHWLTSRSELFKRKVLVHVKMEIRAISEAKY